jgi:hypothetical protein
VGALELLSVLSKREEPRVGFSNVGCSLYVTFSMNVAGTSVLLGPTATSLMDHLRIGKPSLAGGRSLRMLWHMRLREEGTNRLRNELYSPFNLDR